MGQEVTKVLTYFGNKIVDSMKKTLLKNRKFNSGRLVNSITSNVSNDTLVITMVDYGKYVDSGRRSGAKQPPVQAILDWFKFTNGRKFLSKNKIKPAGQKGAAFWVAKKISKTGIKPVKFLNRRQQFENITTFKQDLANAVVKDSQLKQKISKA